jgi:hypothetical protein
MRNSFNKIKNVKSRFLSGKNIYRIILIFSFQFSIFNFQCLAQTAPGIEWQNTIGGNQADYLHSVKQTLDGGYILGGYSTSNISGDKNENNWDTSMNSGDYWIIKTDSAGNIQWQNTIGGNDNDLLFSIQQTSDKGYILGGLSYSDSSGDKTENIVGPLNFTCDYWIVKTDSLGYIQWQNTIGGNDNEEFFSVQQTTDGGYILDGTSYSDISGDKTENTIGGFGYQDYWIVKTDSLGNIKWQNTIGGDNGDQASSIQQTTDGGYILGGGSRSNISGDKTENNCDTTMSSSDFWIVKIDSVGNIQWQNTIGGSNFEGATCLQQTADGGYIIGGTSESNISCDKTENSNGGNDYLIVKTDSLGNIQWQNTIGGSDWDELQSIEQTSDMGYILGGLSKSNISGDKTENCKGGYDYWIVKTDNFGNIQWQRTIGGSSGDLLVTVRQTWDEGYILAGWSASNISGDKTENSNGNYDYWIIKLFPDTITGISQLPQLPNYPITISPNPVTTQSKLTFKNPNKEKYLFTLYDITGRVTESVSTTNGEIILTKGSKPAGVYLFNLENEKTGERWNGKMLVGK